MNQERLYEIIRYPHVSEKTARLQADANQYVFEVRKDATKTEIKKAVEKLFDVHVEQVQVSNVKGKVKSFRFNIGPM
jgi:large subunit ribosomal protein L23